MVLRIYANRFLGDPDFVAACQAEGIQPLPASEYLTRQGEPFYRGLVAWATDVANTGNGAAAADVKAAFSQLGSLTDPQVQALMRFVAAKTPAVVYDPGS